jgi:hypothetical protein
VQQEVAVRAWADPGTLLACEPSEQSGAFAEPKCSQRTRRPATKPAQNSLGLAPIGFHLAGGLLGLMHPETGEWYADPKKLGVLVKPCPQFEIGGDGKAGIDPPARSFPE